MATSSRDEAWICSPPLVDMSSIARIGVMNVPSRLDVVAATMAPAMLPWAIEVKLIDDCTVEGTRHSHMTPV